MSEAAEWVARRTALRVEAGLHAQGGKSEWVAAAPVGSVEEARRMKWLQQHVVSALCLRVLADLRSACSMAGHGVSATLAERKAMSGATANTRRAKQLPTPPMGAASALLNMLELLTGERGEGRDGGLARGREGEAFLLNREDASEDPRRVGGSRADQLPIPIEKRDVVARRLLLEQAAHWAAHANGAVESMRLHWTASAKAKACRCWASRARERAARRRSVRFARERARMKDSARAFGRCGECCCSPPVAVKKASSVCRGNILTLLTWTQQALYRL